MLCPLHLSWMLGKHGVPSDECMELVNYVKEDCAHLSFDGLMTIGRMNHHPGVSGPNPDFVVIMYICVVWCIYVWCGVVYICGIIALNKNLDFVHVGLL